MRLETATEFRLLGRRSYVHSSQVFAEFLKLAALLPTEWKGIRAVRLFKFTRETSRNGRCVIASSETSASRTAASTMSFEASNGTELQFAFIDDGAEAAGGGPDLAPGISNVELTNDFAGRVRLSGSGAPHQLFVDLIEANKALHNATLLKKAAKPLSYRFVYAENFPAEGSGGLELDVGFTARDLRNRGGLTYTLTEIAIAGMPSAAPIRICFSF